MENLLEGIIDFFRVRQLNILVLSILTICYLVYQCGWISNKVPVGFEKPAYSRRSRSQSRSDSHGRTKSPSYYKPYNDTKTRRGRRPAHRRCDDYSNCDD